MPGNASPLRWWSEAQLGDAAVRLAPSWRAWLADWMPTRTSDAPGASARLAWDTPADAGRTWRPLGAHGTGAAWLATSGDEVDAIGHLLFGGATPAYAVRAGASQPAQMAAAIAREAADDLRQRLCAVLSVEPARHDAPAHVLFRPWSGAVVISLQCAPSRPIELLLDGGCAAQLVPAARSAAAGPLRSRTDLVPVDVACAAQHVAADVRLAACELDFGTLASLRVGDIIPLPHALDAPLDVVLDGKTLCSGFLGRHGDTKAIELAREPSTAAA